MSATYQGTSNLPSFVTLKQTSATNNEFIFTPNEGTLSGQYQIDLTLNDGPNTVTDSFLVIVNLAPYFAQQLSILYLTGGKLQSFTLPNIIDDEGDTY